MNIPIYRAKEIDSDEYIIGSLDFNASRIDNTFYHIITGNRYNHTIDPTTLSIHFSNMVDSEGNKIFASLSEDGKGGDIIHRDGMTFETIYKSVNGRFEAYEINGMHHLLAHKFHQTKIIGIQQ